MHESLLTLSFFFRSGVMKPFLAFLALEASSIRLRTSARLRSISACLAFLAYIDLDRKIYQDVTEIGTFSMMTVTIFFSKSLKTKTTQKTIKFDAILRHHNT